MRPTVVNLLATLALLCAGPGCAPPDDDGPSGSRLYFDHCSSCHAPDGTGSARGPSLFERAVDYSRAQIVDVILVGEGLMDPVPLTEAEAEAVADYLTTTLLAN